MPETTEEAYNRSVGKKLHQYDHLKGKQKKVMQHQELIQSQFSIIEDGKLMEDLIKDGTLE